MTSRWRRALAAWGVVVLASIAAPPAARAADCAGVAVVVDFRSLGGGVRTGCAAGDPASGTAALTAAGFGFTFAARQPGFVCRIDGLPGQDRDACVGTSPTTAYWSYWHARPGGSWVYSSGSASAHDPAPGTVEGWAFGAGEQPGAAPPAPAPPVQPPAPPQPAPRQPAPPPPAAQPPAAQPPVAGSPPPATTPGTGPPTDSPGPGTTPATTASPSSSDTPAGGTAAASSGAPPTGAPSTAVGPAAAPSSGGAVGLVAGLAVVALLAGAGAWVARRRAKGAG
ncbi:hypothetical protein [Saccharothrix sp. Mg75]|uniref:hypothetical protein n=1 Tax=Saccharothrix sp. Mg75 TaxID=3445357 RepID=UPI003EED7FA8